MAFFGVEVKPTKPFTHPSDKVKGRLRISQATLGIGSATKKSLVQCNVGNKIPVLLCVLIPDKTESCQLDLEFEEAEDVVFSVIGPRSVFLTGYYVSNSRHYNMNSDTESYGEDVGNTETEESNHFSDEDKYEDSFINDDEPVVLPPSPVSSDGVDMRTQEDDKPKDRKGNPKRLKKRYQVIESDDDASLEDSEDDDDYLLSVFKSKRAAKTVSSKSGENIDKLAVATGGETENPDSNGRESMEKAEAVNVNSEPISEVDGINCEKPKKKRKERSKDVKILEETSHHNEVKAEHTEVESGNTQQDLLINHKKHRSTEMEIDAHPAKSGSKSGPKSKKRRKDLEGESVEGNHPQSEAVKGEQFTQVVKADNMGKDVPATTEEDQIPSSNKFIQIKPDVVADGCLSEKKNKTKKKRKSKTQGNEGHLNMITPLHEKSERGEDKLFMKFENKHVNATSSEVRTLSNGLIIQELAKGEPDGKIAAPGRKVKVYYTAMLKGNGHVFDSNIGKSPYKFRLGNEEVIEGWNLGIDGMHIGDKRRLIIPPSMGYGNQGGGENVPPNSWLVYDVELVDVRR